MDALLLCSRCGAELRSESQFCARCGEPVAASQDDDPAIVRTRPARPPKPRQLRGKPRLAIWFVLPPLLLASLWAAFSDDSAAEQVRQFVLPSHVETLTPPSFSVKSRSFSAFRFTVPEVATGVSVTGQFTAAGGGTDNDVEVYVLGDAAFVSWQYGYAPNSYFSSGKASRGEIAADLPSGSGAYYLVINNKFSTRTAKTVQASVTLRYRNWWQLRKLGF